VPVYGAVSHRLRCASREDLRFHGSSASTASTVVAVGSCSNSSLKYLKVRAIGDFDGPIFTIGD